MGWGEGKEQAFYIRIKTIGQILNKQYQQPPQQDRSPSTNNQETAVENKQQSTG